MANPSQDIKANTDPTASDRKKDHIALAFESRVTQDQIDQRFYYEPIAQAHPIDHALLEMIFLGKPFKAPIWVSSMTGGTGLAKTINQNLAKACGEYGLGMGLGSCRQLLESDEYLADFQVRKWMHDQPLYANLGIAQLEQLIANNQMSKITELILKLEADGLIVHVNPMQEWLQPEGDRFVFPPLDTIKRLIDALPCKMIVKEVGQGMGPKSLKSLIELPLEAIDFGANGGTNFALLELLRADPKTAENFMPLANIGHSALEMVEMVNYFMGHEGVDKQCTQFIISGGIQDFLDGFYHMSKMTSPSIYGQASGFLKHAMANYEDLQCYVEAQIKGLALANTFLTAK